MLAKELKIKTLKRQREFILEQFTRIMDERNDGNPAYIYAGQVYPEVIEYFRSEGFEVTKVMSDTLYTVTYGCPTYLFTVGDIKLTDDELIEVEEYEPEEKSSSGDEHRSILDRLCRKMELDF